LDSFYRPDAAHADKQTVSQQRLPCFPWWIHPLIGFIDNNVLKTNFISKLLEQQMQNKTHQSCSKFKCHLLWPNETEQMLARLLLKTCNTHKYCHSKKKNKSASKQAVNQL